MTFYSVSTEYFGYHQELIFIYAYQNYNRVKAGKHSGKAILFQTSGEDLTVKYFHVSLFFFDWGGGGLKKLNIYVKQGIRLRMVEWHSLCL
jgi:hypothetical protein